MALWDGLTLRIPDKWSATWFRTWVTEALVPYLTAAVQTAVSALDIVVDFTNALLGHNADPFADEPVIDAHKAESNPHGQYRLPVGSIFFTPGNVNPALLLGYGTWELRGQGQQITGGSEALVAPPNALYGESGGETLISEDDGSLLLGEV